MHPNVVESKLFGKVVGTLSSGVGFLLLLGVSV